MRITHWLLGALCLAAAATGSRAAGTIDETGATITIGTGTPQGTKTVNAAAPAAAAPAIPPVGTLGAIGTFSSQLPAFPGGGTGADDAFTGVGDVAASGGTLSFTTYTVDPGAVVTYAGSVTIKTTGNVVLNGTVTTTAAGASITFLCGGSFTMGAAGKVQTATAASPILLDSSVSFTTVAGAQVLANGDCEIRTHGGDVTLAATAIRAQAGALSLRSSQRVVATGNSPLTSTNGALLIQAFGADVALSGLPGQPGPAPAVTAGAHPLTIEAASDAVFTWNVTFTGAAGPTSISAFGGDVKFTNAVSILGGSGAVVAASAGVQISGTSTSRLQPGGDLVITAFGGDVTTLRTDLTCDEDLTVQASGSVLFGGSTLYDGFDDVLIRALGDRVDLTGVGAIGLVDIDAGTLDVRAAGQITVDVCFCIASANGAGDGISFSAGAGGVTLGANANVIVASDLNLKITALGPVAIGGLVRSNNQGDVVVTSCDAGVTLAGGTLETSDDNKPTGDITVQSFADTAGVIDLTGGTIVTGDSSAKSGDVKLVVHLDKTAGGGRSVSIDSFLLPKSVVVKTNAKTPSKSKVTISGTIDEGSAEPCWTEPLSLEVGAKTFSFSGMTEKGKSFEYTEPGLLFRVTPAKTASSRGKFLLVRTADLTGEVNRDGALALRVAGTGIDAKGGVTLTNGKYALGKVRGKLIDPCWFPQSVALTLKGAGQDKVALTMGFETAGYDVTMDPCWTIGIGGAFTAEVPRGSFTVKGQRLIAKGNFNGITEVTIDLAKERITVKGKAMTLTGLTATSGPVKITMTLDTVALGVDERSVNVALVGAGKSLKY